MRVRLARNHHPHLARWPRDARVRVMRDRGGRVTDRDWWPLINKRAALKEQFPSLATVLKERPGTTTDREMQEFYRADNRLYGVRSYTPRHVREAAHIAEVEAIVREQQAKERAAFLKRLGRTA